MDPNRFRDDFPILKRLIRGKPLVYLDNAATTQKPRAVLQAMADFYENHNANIHRGVHTLSDEATQLYDEARAKTAAFIGAPKPESVIFTRNATEAINLVAYAWGRKFLSGGDEILLTEMEHHSNLVPWQILCQEKGVRLRFIPVTPEGTLDLQAAAKVITPKTKLVSFTACSNALGTINPVSELVALARSVGAKCLIDASQWTPHFPTDVVKWDCDFLVFSGHKMLGPLGIGALYAKPELLEAMNPFLAGGDMIRQVFLERSTYGELPNKFEAGTPSVADAVGLGAAVDYLRAVGWDALREHERALTARAVELLGAMDGVKLHGPADLQNRGGIVSFNVDGIHAHDVGTALDLEGVAVRAGHHCCQPLMMKLKVPGTARASFYLYNTLAEVESMAAAVRKTVDFFRKPASAGRTT